MNKKECLDSLRWSIYEHVENMGNDGGFSPKHQDALDRITEGGAR